MLAVSSKQCGGVKVDETSSDCQVRPPIPAVDEESRQSRFQFRLRTLLLLFFWVGVYVTLFMATWHWTIFLTATVIPVIVWQSLLRRWSCLSEIDKTLVRALLFASIAFFVWIPWVVLCAHGPCEAIVDLAEELPLIEKFFWNWSDAWRW